MHFDPTFSFGALIASVIGILVSTVGFLIVRTLTHLEKTLNNFDQRLLKVENIVSTRQGYIEGFEAARLRYERGQT